MLRVECRFVRVVCVVWYVLEPRAHNLTTCTGFLEAEIIDGRGKKGKVIII